MLEPYSTAEGERANGANTSEGAARPARPAYAPPAIEMRMPLETTAAFCDTAMNGKEFPLCTGPINS